MQVLDADVEEDGTPFVAMELLEGEPLRAAIARGDLTPQATLRLFDGLLDALGAAHAAGFVHRDLKPENVFVVSGARPEVRILDFGLARREGSISITETNTALGTPRYMSPEQFMNAKGVGPPADVWAVGVMLYEALSGGQRPFGARSSNALMLQILTAPHAPLEARIPAALARLVDRCLDKEPGKRPADGAALRRELSAIGRALDASDATTTPRPPRAPAIERAGGARARGSSRRWMIPAALIAILALSAVTGALVWILDASAPAPPPPPHPTVLVPTAPVPDPTPMLPIVVRPVPPSPAAAAPARARSRPIREPEPDELDEADVPEAPEEPASVLDPLLRGLPLP